MDYQSKERPILFNGEMVRAILDGRKTQTRRVVKPQPPEGRVWVLEQDHRPPFSVCMDDQLEKFPGPYEWKTWHCPYGVPGDRLWVREAIRRKPAVTGRWSGATYLADLTPVAGKGPMGSYCGRALVNWKWKRDVLPSIHMPRWASRIMLEITDVRVERVQDISEDNAKAEDVDCMTWINHPGAEPSYRVFFWILWDSINAKRGLGWDVNPWVWVVEFQHR